MRKAYVKPSIRTEIIEVGVFGDYDGGGSDDNFFGFWNPFFGICCGGGGG